MSSDHPGIHDQVIAIINDTMAMVGMTQVEMGRRMGWTPKHINQILNGNAEPSMASLSYMCFILGIELEVRAR